MKKTNFVTILKEPLVITIFVYLLLVVLSNPTGEFAVNDAWIYKRSVDAFLMGDFKINALIDASVILHIFLGYLWALVFGSSFFSLKLLTILQTILLFIGVSKLIKLFSVTKQKEILALSLVLVNPLIFTSSLSFMSEISFLLFMVWSLYFFTLGIKKDSFLYITIGATFGGGAILIRQIGVVLFIAFLLTQIISLIKSNNQKEMFKIAIAFFITVASIFIWVMWPRYDFSVAATKAGSVQNGFADLTSKLIQVKQIPKRLGQIVYIPYYLGYFLAPLLILFVRRSLFSTKIKKFIAFFATTVFAYIIYFKDIFPIGNVFYVEGFYIKSNFRTNFSLFDNVSFKLFLSGFIAFFTVFAIYRFVNAIFRFEKGKVILKTKDLNTSENFLLLNTLGMLSVVTLGNDFYDRYLLPFVVSLILFVLTQIKEIKVTKWFYIIAAVMVLHTVVLQYEFHVTTRLKWEQGQEISDLTGYVSNMYVSGVFQKYVHARRNNDYTGEVGYLAPGAKPRCFVSKYTLDSTAKRLEVLQTFDNFLQKKIDNPKIFGSKKSTSLSRAKNNLDNLIYNEEYFSPLYNFVGKKAFVGSWCLEEDS